jgi:hypothetical protein
MSDNAKPDEPRSAEPAPSETPSAEPRRRALALPEGSIGLFLLVVFAALFGGLTATYWPLLIGSETGISEERVAALETRVGEIATGRPGAAASGAFAELRRNLASLSDRLLADEARLTALEKAQAAAPAVPGAPPASTTAPLRNDMNVAAATLGQLNDRLTALERTSASAEQIRGFNETMGRLQARVAALDADIARTSETHRGALDAVNARLAKIEAALPPELAQRLDLLAPRTDVAAAEARIAHLEEQNSGQSLHRAAAVLALATLSSAAAEGRPFTVELDALAAAQPGDAAIAALRPWAATGVPTVPMLRARFPGAARAALEVSRSAVAADFFSRLWTNIESLISVRRVGEVKGTDPEARLARAQVRVTAGDMTGAVAEVGAIPAPSALPLAPWLRDAKARVTLERTLAQLNARVVREVALSATQAAIAPVTNVAPSPPPDRPPVPVPAPPREQRPSPNQ